MWLGVASGGITDDHCILGRALKTSFVWVFLIVCYNFCLGFWGIYGSQLQIKRRITRIIAGH